MNINKSQIDINKKYLEKHNVAMYIEELMSEIIEKKPDEPLNFMIRYLQKRVLQINPNLPLRIKSEVANLPTDTPTSRGSYKKSATSKSLDKSLVFDTLKKEFDAVSNNQTMSPVSLSLTQNPSYDSHSTLNEEFQLVAGNELNPQDSTESQMVSFSKCNRNASKSKENLLKQINEERILKANEQLKLEATINHKDQEAYNTDSAVELCEDPELYSNEFNIPSTSSIVKPESGVVIVKRLVSNENNNKASVNLSICANCSKFFHSDNNSAVKSVSGRNSKCDASRASVIMDDIESASQVDGPRKISDQMDFGTDRSKYSRKKISVSDFASHSKAWPVLDTSSESSSKRNC